MIKLGNNIRWLTYVLLVNVTASLIFELCLFAPHYAAASKFPQESIEDNEFAEFERIEDDGDEFIDQPSQSQPSPQAASTPPPVNLQPNTKAEDNDGIVEDDYNEEFTDESTDDEFDNVKSKPVPPAPKQNEPLTFTKIPLHLRSNWESYYLEFLMVFGLVVYFVNFISGKSKNYSLANSWYEKNLELLQYNFSLVGDDGKKEIENFGLVKETENVYSLWCSGRNSLEGMLVEIQLLKRQDLLSMIINYFKPTTDKIVVKACLNSDAMDNFVFSISNRKSAIRLSKEMNDIATFCPERKNADKYGVNDSYVLLNEIGEAASFILDAKVIALLNKNEDIVDYIHISDQYSGLRSTDDTQQATKLPEVKRMLIGSFNLPPNSTRNVDELERLKPLLQMLLYLVDKLKRFKMSKESKTKSDKNRQKVEKLFLQSTHLQRQEMAQAKREEKRRVEKEKMLQEEDPDKQRRWEEKEYKRELKRKVPKMKQLKVKAM